MNNVVPRICTDCENLYMVYNHKVEIKCGKKLWWPKNNSCKRKTKLSAEGIMTQCETFKTIMRSAYQHKDMLCQQ